MTGMLWLDDSQTSLEDKVRNAAAYYQQKYGQAPTWCLANAGQLAEKTAVDGIAVKPSTSTLKDHLFMGVGQ